MLFMLFTALVRILVNDYSQLCGSNKYHCGFLWLNSVSQSMNILPACSAWRLNRRHHRSVIWRKNGKWKLKQTIYMNGSASMYSCRHVQLSYYNGNKMSNMSTHCRQSNTNGRRLDTHTHKIICTYHGIKA